MKKLHYLVKFGLLLMAGTQVVKHLNVFEAAGSMFEFFMGMASGLMLVGFIFMAFNVSCLGNCKSKLTQ